LTNKKANTPKEDVVIEGSYEVFALVDEASHLMMYDDTVPGFTALDIVACQVMASDLAHGAEEVTLELPASVGECIDQAARRAADWDPAQLTTEALRLVLLLSDVRHTLVKG
jgi:hypothetical protein